jgi:hypothetical protein
MLPYSRLVIEALRGKPRGMHSLIYWIYPKGHFARLRGNDKWYGSIFEVRFSLVNL